MGKLKSVEELFEGRHFEREIIILCVRWYLRFKLSLRDLVEMMAERGLSMAHTTIMRWVQRYAPEFEKRWRRYAQAVGQSWRVASARDSLACDVWVFTVELCLTFGTRCLRPEVRMAQQGAFARAGYLHRSHRGMAGLGQRQPR